MSENSKFEELVDRLEKCSLIRYPSRLWGDIFRKYVITGWINREKQLEQRVLKFENEITESIEYKQVGNRLTGHLVDYPESISEGSTLEELKINLVDALYHVIKAKNSGN